MSESTTPATQNGRRLCPLRQIRAGIIFVLAAAGALTLLWAGNSLAAVDPAGTPNDGVMRLSRAIGQALAIGVVVALLAIAHAARRYAREHAQARTEATIDRA